VGNAAVTGGAESDSRASVNTKATAPGSVGPGDQSRPAGALPAPLWPVIALSTALAIGLFLVFAPGVRMLLPLIELPDPLPDHHQDAETLTFVVSFLILLPLSVLVSSWAADRIAAGPKAGGLSAVSAGLALVLLFSKISAQLPGVGRGCTCQQALAEMRRLVEELRVEAEVR
jgi:hypothetical protein